MNKIIELDAIIPEEAAGQRLDQALAKLFPDYSRACLQQWVKDKQLTVDGAHWKNKDKVQGGEAIAIHATLTEATDWHKQDLPLDVVYEDADVLVVNKAPGVVTHPAAGNPDGTLVNAILHHAPECAALPRGGLIHRLDKDTSGLLVIAKSLTAHNHLVQQLQARTMKRHYYALVYGDMTGGGTVDAPLGRHPKSRKKQAILEDGKPAVTHYRIAERFPHHTLLRIQLETGRTHQIRVHMASIHHSVVGDPVYSRNLLPKGASEPLKTALQQFRRQALHAAELAFEHPTQGETLNFEAPLPEDMAHLLEVIRQES